MIQSIRKAYLYLVIATAIAHTGTASAQIINEDFKLFASEGVEEDQFGIATDIDNGLAVVGAYLDNISGTDSGSAYVLNATTGSLVSKLVPGPLSDNDHFGFSVAIDNNIVAVGSPGNDTIGTNSGSAALFDATTGQLLFTLLPADGIAYEEFGHSIAIDSGIVAVGSHRDDDNGGDSGSVYLFDAATGVQINKLLPADGLPGDRFGHAASIHNGILAVGARLSDARGIDSGAVYTFDVTNGTQLAKITPTSGVAGDEFGYAVSVDNGIVAIGAPFADNSSPDAGAMYLFNAVTGAPLASALANNLAPGDNFGYSIGLSAGVIVVGTRNQDTQGSNSGAAYVFEFTLFIVEQFKLLPDVGAIDDLFGHSVAIQNGTIIAGAPQSDLLGSNSGAAFAFDAGTGLQTATFHPSGGAAGHRFGSAVALDNGVVAVGAPFDDQDGPESGSAYLMDATTGQQLLKILPQNLALFKRDYNHFGNSIAIRGGSVAVGFGGSGSIFMFDSATGMEFTVLFPIDVQFFHSFGNALDLQNGLLVGGSPGDDQNGHQSGSASMFDVNPSGLTARNPYVQLLPPDAMTGDLTGASVAMDNGVVVVGAPGSDGNGNFIEPTFAAGSIYLFDAFTGIKIAKLTPTDYEFGKLFGSSVAIENNIIAVGAPGDNANGVSSGSAYLFDATNGNQIAKLLPNDGAASDTFGTQIEISNGIVAVSAPLDGDNGFRSGSVYLFDISTGAQIAKLLPSDGGELQGFGISIAIQNGIVVVGAHHANHNGFRSGTVYMFTVPGQNCLADLNNDGILDNGDISTFISLFLSGNLTADMNSDGFLDNGDIGAFIAAFLAGC